MCPKMWLRLKQFPVRLTPSKFQENHYLVFHLMVQKQHKYKTWFLFFLKHITRDFSALQMRVGVEHVYGRSRLFLHFIETNVKYWRYCPQIIMIFPLFSRTEWKPCCDLTVTMKSYSATNELFSWLQTENCSHRSTAAGPSGWLGQDIRGGNPTPAASVVPFRSNTFSPLKSPSSVRVKSGQVHIFQLHYLKRCGSSAK